MRENRSVCSGTVFLLLPGAVTKFYRDAVLVVISTVVFPVTHTYMCTHKHIDIRVIHMCAHIDMYMHEYI